jgi:hypothetical protein
LHIGNDLTVPLKDIIAILDLETSGRAATTREFLATNKPTLNKHLSANIYKSCIITDGEVFYSSISSGTLLKRTTILFEPFAK